MSQLNNHLNNHNEADPTIPIETDTLTSLNNPVARPAPASPLPPPSAAAGSSVVSSISDLNPKNFPYQASKNELHTSSSIVGTTNPMTGSVVSSSVVPSDDWVILRAEPSDKRFAGETVHISVSRADAAYNLKPIHCGRSVVFLNAQDPNFYLRELVAPALTVWILCGMPISQSHALKRMFEAGWRQNIQVKVMEVNKFELLASKDGLDNLLYEGKAVELPDCIFNRVGANVGYFGLAVIRQLEVMGCLLFNSLRSIEISRDKMLTVQHLAAHGLPIPKTLLAKFPLNLDTIKREFEYPIIIKKASGSQGKGIIKVDTHSQLEDLVDMLDTGKPMIIQELIQPAGKDLRVFVIGGRVVGAMMRIAAKGQFKANVHQGGSVKPVKISAQVEWLVLETVKIIGLDIAGVDLLIDKQTYKICEVNSSPGFEGLETALGENIAVKMFMYMKMRLGVWRRNTKGTPSRMQVNVPVQEEHAQTDQDEQPTDEFKTKPLSTSRNKRTSYQS